jgi:hypothetical protein
MTTDPTNPEERASHRPWLRVVFAAECADDGLCPVCQDVEFADCPCPGPTMHELYEYLETEDGLRARLKPEAERG